MHVHVRPPTCTILVRVQPADPARSPGESRPFASMWSLDCWICSSGIAGSSVPTARVPNGATTSLTVPSRKIRPPTVGLVSAGAGSWKYTSAGSLPPTRACSGAPEAVPTGTTSWIAVPVGGLHSCNRQQRVSALLLHQSDPQDTGGHLGDLQESVGHLPPLEVNQNKQTADPNSVKNHSKSSTNIN